jgi:hypothetical protein
MGLRGGIRAATASAILSCATLLYAAATPADPSARILRFEPLPALALATGSSGAQKSTQRHLEFEAYGKVFQLALEENSRLSPLLQQKSATFRLELYRGSLEGIDGSWVRLAVRDGDVRGMIWDGVELYAIEKTADIADALVEPLDENAPDAVIFRLSDTLLEEGARLCAADDIAKAQTGDEAYESLVGELKGGVVGMQAAGATARIELSVLADSAFLERRNGEQAVRDDILLRLNNVDGIFSSQLDIEVQVPSIDVARPGTDPLSGTTSASDLLEELGALRARTPALRSRGLTHLFTGRDLNGSTVGIAYLDSLCHKQYGVGLTEAARRGAWIESLVAAHEIGHNFGAVHDGQGACSSTPQNQYLMSPSVNSNTSTFSQCSLNSMRPRARYASCVTDLPPPDLAVGAFGPQRHAVGRPFEWQVSVTNVGGSAAENSRIEISLPPVIDVDSAYVAGGSCVSGAGIVFCYMGDIAAGASRIVNLTLKSDTSGSNTVSATVAASRDASSSNNTHTSTIAIDPENDLSVTLLTPAAVTAPAGFEARYTITNLSAHEASGVVVTIDVPQQLAATAFSLADGLCAQQGSGAQCTLSTLPAGATAEGTVTLTAQSAGSAVLRVHVSGSYVDPAPHNDAAEQTVVVAQTTASAQSASPGSSSGGGGGGSLGIGALLALSAMAAGRKRMANGTARLIRVP